MLARFYRWDGVAFFKSRTENYHDADAPPGREVTTGAGDGSTFSRLPSHRTHQRYTDAVDRSARERRGKGGPYTVGSPAVSREAGWADTVVSIERKVVSGHAYAIPAPEALTCGRCGYD
ncbi:hypothetical protein Misp04_24950 [Micromonospora sp. NBRC 101691]|nr:hypothetical protein Misp04_24950 [Micromonospora sp. NBRC 101691]